MSVNIKTSADGLTIWKIENKNGMSIEVSNYGGLLTALNITDKNGVMQDVVLGFDTIEEYKDNPCNFGAIIGRHANRIANGIFSIDGVEYHLIQNEKGNNLHSGPHDYKYRMWDAKVTEDSVIFSMDCPENDQGYPGDYKVSCEYKLTDDNELVLNYTALSNMNTITNITNHSYFNLSGNGSGSIDNQIFWVNADKYTPLRDSGSIPTGELADVAGTPFDFREPKEIGKDLYEKCEQLEFTGGYDHNYVLKIKDISEVCAYLYSKETGIKMEVYTDLPGLQFYSGNYIYDIPQTGKNGVVYQKGDGLCLESQYFPDAINQPNFENPIIKANTLYKTTTIYKFIVE